VLKVGFVTNDLSRSKGLITGLDSLGDMTINVVIASPNVAKDVLHYDLGRAHQQSDLMLFDGLHSATMLYSALGSAKPFVIRAMGPEILVPEFMKLNWGKLKGLSIPSPYYGNNVWPKLKAKLGTNTIAKISSIPATVNSSEISYHPNYKNSQAVMFHHLAPEYSLFPLVAFLKNNPTYSISVVGSPMGPYDNLLRAECVAQDVDPSRLEIFSELKTEILEEFVQDHPFILSVRPDESVFHHVREFITYGCVPVIQESPISREMFPECVHDISQVKLDEEYPVDGRLEKANTTKTLITNEESQKVAELLREVSA